MAVNLRLLFLLVCVCLTSRALAQLQANSVPASPVDEAPAVISMTDAMLPAPSGDEPRLDAGDLLEIRVFDTPELSEKVRISSDGTVTLPVGGEVSVKELTVAQAQSVIEDRLRDRNILRDPHVNVLVMEYATQGVSVLGEVRNPGVYPLQGKHTVLDFISLAGGLTQAASKTVSLSHKQSPSQIIQIDLNNPQNTAQPEVEVLPGDRIVVERSGLVYVVGDVGRPGGYLIENRKTITVLQALALAQGINKTAKLDAKLIRTTAAGRTASDLPLKKILANQASDPTVQDGDILFVPVSGGKQWADRGISSILQLAVGLAIWR